MAFLQHNRNKRVLKALFSVIQGPILRRPEPLTRTKTGLSAVEREVKTNPIINL